MYGRVSAQTVSTMAALAYAAYGYGDGDLAVQLATHAPGWRALGPAALGLAAGDFDTDGYYDRNGATGYVALSGTAVAIVFRGSDSVDDLVSVASDQASYFQSLRPMIEAALAYASATGAGEIILAGHSLGAAMVQRTAATMDGFVVPAGVQWTMAAFGSPGTDVDNKTPLSRTVVNVGHTGDPVPDDPLLSDLTQHGPFTTVALPNVEGAGSLAELAQQKAAQSSDPSIVIEHDMGRYLSTARAIAESPLAGDAADDTLVIVLDAPDGSPINDTYAMNDENALLLGGGGDDGLIGSDVRDLIDGGAGNDALFSQSGDDLLSGGQGNDDLRGGDGVDTASFLTAIDNYEVRTHAGVTFVISAPGGTEGTDRLEAIELLRFGGTLSGTPAENFDALAYIASYPDLIAAFATDDTAGFVHYATYGAAEGRGISFNELQYIASFGDLIIAFGADGDAGSRH
ncbi:MAG TPA: hypothetical protein VES39_02265, partial [Rhodospirillales bacterium]|nr:hypothetical protein [Rhodospirillales bacterium]